LIGIEEAFGLLQPARGIGRPDGFVCFLRIFGLGLVLPRRVRHVALAEIGFDHEKFAIYVWRSVRATGDTKTKKSRRTLELPTQAATALKNHRTAQLKERLAAGPLWHEHGLVFTSQSGEPLDAANVRRSLRAITRRAKLGENWTPRELRHSFVSIMSDNGVPIETIADLVGHASTAVTETVYRHQLKPVITRGAETMNTIFTEHAETKSA